jgi:hypothetical protein
MLFLKAVLETPLSQPIGPAGFGFPIFEERLLTIGHVFDVTENRARQHDERTILGERQFGDDAKIDHSPFSDQIPGRLSAVSFFTGALLCFPRDAEGFER